MAPPAATGSMCGSGRRVPGSRCRYRSPAQGDPRMGPSRVRSASRPPVSERRRGSPTGVHALVPPRGAVVLGSGASDRVPPASTRRLAADTLSAPHRPEWEALLHRLSRVRWALLLGVLLLLAAIPVAVAATQSTTYPAATADGSGAAPAAAAVRSHGARPIPRTSTAPGYRRRATARRRGQRSAAPPRSPRRCWRTSTGRAAATAP